MQGKHHRGVQYKTNDIIIIIMTAGRGRGTETKM